jgi:hypothetical protein
MFTLALTGRLHGELDKYSGSSGKQNDKIRPNQLIEGLFS